ncbi:hypothetical protein FGO68_gene11147 [Halteria grandinella]|uniref:Testis expressed 9 n=1 Tax=Halteria grandinella TaxID=5974 RepID=A0A8J8NMC8_HALGN|nr:hypothetical protein FGO68_gene11147 [Halteria grandinella]
MNKLDYLAQKEEELLKMNERLDLKKEDLFKPQVVPEFADSLDARKTDANPFVEEQKEEEVFRASTNSLLKEAHQLRESYKVDKPVAQAAPARNEDDDFDHEDSSRLQQLLERVKEQEKTINFQKAKIIALQTELEDTVKSQAKNEGKLEDLQASCAKLTEDNKKLTEKLNSQNLGSQKLKTQNADLQTRVLQLEKTVAEQSKDLEAGEREKRKAFQDQGARDVKLNRAIEELEKYKTQLKEAKVTEISKGDQLRKDMDRLIEENRKLERQRNELMAAFKKQMKLIDVLKRQKMHIEAAKLLAFTEDEFVKTLELGDKI